ncbi:MAG: glycosyltransferase family 4 protein [Patescibacteria group bacterium]|nr:glycosyltransferase family 4 protein [Patescibacteria group bacterium]
MKKSLLITNDFPPKTGGVANYLSNLSENLPHDKIVVLADKSVGQTHHHEIKYRLIKEDLFYRFFWPRWLKTCFVAKKIIDQEKIEQVIISHVLPMGYVAMLLGLPYFVILHGLDIVLAKKSIWKRYWLKKILNRAKHVIINSNFTKKEVLDIGISEDKITIVNPCPNFQKMIINETEKQIIKNELDLHHKKILLSVGRLIPRKGFDKVIETLPQVLKQVPSLVYLIVGRGPDRERLEKLAEKLSVLGNITIVEDVPDSNLPVYYDLADVFIMPSRIVNKTDVEGFGIVYLEANLLGKPVIAGKSGGVEDAVIDNQTGILVNPEDANAIAIAIIKLFSDENLANTLGVQGKARVLNEFCWSKQIAKIENIL